MQEWKQAFGLAKFELKASNEGFHIAYSILYFVVVIFPKIFRPLFRK